MATGDVSQTDLQVLRQTVTSLERRLASVEGRLDGNTEPPALDVEKWRDEIVRVTKELFPGEVSIKLMNDPEYPADWLHVVEAEASGDIPEIVDRRLEWHKRLRGVSPELGDLAISLAIRE